MLAAAATPAPVLVVMFDSARAGDYFRIARLLRAAGVATEVYPEAKAVGKQLKYANRQGFDLAVIAGDDEFSTGCWQVKDLRSGEQKTIPETELTSHINALLQEGSRHGDTEGKRTANRRE